MIKIIKTRWPLIRDILVLQTCGMCSVITAKLPKTVEDQYNSGEIKSYRKHPGIRKHESIDLPESFKASAHKILTEYYSKQFRKDAEKLEAFLHHRVLPASDQQIREKAQVILEKLNQKENFQNSLNDPEIEKKLEQKKEHEIRKTLKESFRQWISTDYNTYQGLLYLYARAAPTYAATIKVFQELLKADPNFKPATLFDFGSGIGTTIWAAHNIWEGALKEYFCVDIADNMNEISRLLLKDGNEENENKIKEVFYRQYMPASTTLMYDLTVSCYALLEIKTVEERLQAIDTLWRKTSDYLVIIENGTKAGFTTVLEARDYILGQSRKTNENPVYVVAPCPHDLQCPKFVRENQRPCGFPVSYIKFTEEESVVRKREVYSYVILRKGNPPDERWPRLVSEVLPRDRHVICRMCCPDGNLKEAIITRKKHKGVLYKCARQSSWGDLLPLEMLEVKEDLNDEQREIT